MVVRLLSEQNPKNIFLKQLPCVALTGLFRPPKKINNLQTYDLLLVIDRNLNLNRNRNTKISVWSGPKPITTYCEESAPPVFLRIW